MRGFQYVFRCTVALALLGAAHTADAQTPEAQALRQEIDQLRQEFQTLQKQYGDRLTALETCLLYTSPSPRDGLLSRMPSSA